MEITFELVITGAGLQRCVRLGLFRPFFAQLHQLPGDLPHKTGDLIILGLPPDHPLLRTCQRQIFHGPGDSHIAQTAFLLQLVRVVRHHRHIAGEDPVLHPRQIHLGKFQPFRAVQGHEQHLVLILVHRIDVRHQGHLLQELAQTRRIGSLVVGRRLRDQLPDVLDPPFCLVRALRLQVAHIAGLLDDLL